MLGHLTASSMRKRCSVMLDGFILVLNTLSDDISLIDPKDDIVIEGVRVGETPRDLVYVPGSRPTWDRLQRRRLFPSHFFSEPHVHAVFVGKTFLNQPSRETRRL